jgi:hypothetical protein
MALLGGFALSGCASGPLPPDSDMPEEPPIGDLDTPAISTLTTPALQLGALAHLSGDPLPKIEVGPYSAQQVPVVSLLDIITAEQGIALSIEGDMSTLTVNINDPRVRPLDEVVDMITRNAGVFYRYENNILYVEPTRTFTITAPRIGNSLQTLASTFSGLGATNVQVDDVGGIINFEADRTDFELINTYLTEFWHTRDMIIFDAWFFEISLAHDDSLGINWTEFRLPDIGGSNFDISSVFGTGAFDGMTIGVIGDKGGVPVNAVLGFLKTQGDVRSLSKPTLTVISGGQASMQVGETQQYISRLARTVESGVTETASEPDTLELGIDLDLEASYSDGLVYLTIDLRLETLIRFNEFDAADATLRLPETSRREIQTDAHARPGDLILIGGLIQDRAEQSLDQTAILDVPLTRNMSRERVELVIMLRPRVILFRPEQG